VKWQIIIRPRAEIDLIEARAWYESKRPGLSDEFLEEIRRVLTVLEEQPDRRPPYYRELRRVFTRRFPYKLFYLIERERVLVFRILHAKRNHQALL